MTTKEAVDLLVGRALSTLGELDAYCQAVGVQWDIVFGDRLPTEPLSDEQAAAVADFMAAMPGMSDAKVRSIRAMLAALQSV